MYIWRGKNVRDKRNLLLLGEHGWAVPSDEKSHIIEDEKLRHEKEAQHVHYFTKKIRVLIDKYLDTEDGQREINLMRRELERLRRAKIRDPNYKTDIDTEQEDMQKNVLEIFRQFAVAGSESAMEADQSGKAHSGGLMDQDGLRRLMAYLTMPMTDKKFKKYLKKLKFSDTKVVVTFEEFYQRK